MLSAKCRSSGVKTRYRQFRSIADRSRGGECGVFPADAAFATGGAAPRSNAARSGYLGGFLVLPGLPGSDQDIHKVGQEVERAEVRGGTSVESDVIPNSRLRERDLAMQTDLHGCRRAMLDPADDSGSTVRRKVPLSPAFSVRVR